MNQGRRVCHRLTADGGKALPPPRSKFHPLPWPRGHSMTVTWNLEGEEDRHPGRSGESKRKLGEEHIINSFKTLGSLQNSVPMFR